MTGILPSQTLAQMIESGALAATDEFEPGQIQPASLDLRLGRTAYRLRASFLPGAGRTVEDRLNGDIVMHRIDLSEGAVLETGCVYLVPLAERLALPEDVSGAANPKSSTGRIDVFTRVITDGAQAFDAAPAGYQGPLYLEISPRTFSVLVRPRARLAQIRLRRGSPAPLKEITLGVDLTGGESGVIGYRARRHSGLIDLENLGGHDPADFWEPVPARGGRMVLDPDEFYILASAESASVAPDEAAEMAPIATEIGEFRAHYAGFFDPGFGWESAGGAGSRAVLEVRGRDVPFMLEHGQAAARLVYESLEAPADAVYGASGSHYQAQGLKLSKHFGGWG